MSGAGRSAAALPTQLGTAAEENLVALGTTLLSPALARVFGLEQAVAYGEPTTGNDSGDRSGSASASGARRRHQEQRAPGGNDASGAAKPVRAAAQQTDPSATGVGSAPARHPGSATNTARGAHAADPSAAGYTKRVRGAAEEPPAAAAGTAGNGEDGAGASKRARLVWTPQLHSRFVDAVTHLGIKAAVPKTIMQLMNVEGLTRENVASHLQKFRLYTRRLNDAAGGGRRAHSDDDEGEEGP